jgi:hypothetical protein
VRVETLKQQKIVNRDAKMRASFSQLESSS